MNDIAKTLPTPTLHILLALRDEERHGYAIMREAERLSDGAVRLGPGTLYTAIKRLLADGLIEESDERPDSGLDDERRRYYRLTARGAAVCDAELRRLAALLDRVSAARPRPRYGRA